MEYTVNKGDGEHVFHALRAAGYEPLHTSYRRGYISRKTEGIIRRYAGNYPRFQRLGVSLVWDAPAYNTTRYYLREYWFKTK